MEYSDDLIREIFARTKTVAVVGFSANPQRASHSVSQYLADIGMRVIPVNPGLAGQSFRGEVIYASLTDVPDDVDMVDIFRRSEAVPPILSEALKRWPKLPTIWMQLSVMHAQATATAESLGATVIQDRCPKIEFPRLGLT